MTARTLTAGLALVAMAFAACTGDRKDGGSVETAASLRIVVRDTSETLPVTATLACGNKIEGSRFLADAGKAKAACTLITTNQNAAKLLTEPAATDRICTQVYGGPQVARVTGTLKGRIVDRTFKRTNGCEIADWNLLVPLIGDPRGGTGPPETPQ